jgi:hypothetical protein
MLAAGSLVGLARLIRAHVGTGGEVGALLLCVGRLTNQEGKALAVWHDHDFPPRKKNTCTIDHEATRRNEQLVLHFGAYPQGK